MCKRDQQIDATLNSYLSLLKKDFLIVRDVSSGEWICWPRRGKSSWSLWRFGIHCPEHIGFTHINNNLRKLEGSGAPE